MRAVKEVTAQPTGGSHEAVAATQDAQSANLLQILMTNKERVQTAPENAELTHMINQLLRYAGVGRSID